MRNLLSRLGSWLNRKLNIIETDPEMNAYYDRVDRELDIKEAAEKARRKERKS